MQIKLPLVVDISHYESIENFLNISPRPALVIVKATEGLSFVDDSFQYNFNGIKQAGVARGCYHFFHRGYNSEGQAKNFLDTISGQATDKDILILDVEEGGETAEQIKQWLDIVKSRYPENLLMIYSRKNILDNIVMNTAQRDYFKQIPVWTAGYPTYPDLFDRVPPAYVPDQGRFGPVWLWQYSDNGRVEGITGIVDINWIDPILLSLIGISSSPLPVKISEGMEYIKLDRLGTSAHIVKTDLVNKRFYVRYGFSKVSSVAGGSLFACNGDGWNTVEAGKPNSICYSDGRAIQEKQWEWCPWLSVSKDNIPSMSDKDPYGLFNAVSGDRWLVINGKFNEAISERTSKNARTAVGRTLSNEIVFIVVDGDDTKNIGATFPDMASLLIEYGCVEGISLDGGGSSTMCVNGKLVSHPNDDDYYGPSTERSVVNQIIMYSAEDTPPTGETMATKKGVARLYTNVKYMDGVGTTGLGLNVGDWALGDLSPTGSDLINIREINRVAGDVIALEKPCKATAANLIVTDYKDSTPPPPPPPPAEEAVTVTETKTYFITINGVVYSGSSTSTTTLNKQQ